MEQKTYFLTDEEKKRYFTPDASKPGYIEAHKFSTHHREMLEKDSLCGCFSCLAIFHPDEIDTWYDDNLA